MKQVIKLTPASIRKAYVEDYLKFRPNAEEFARFTESELADFIRKHESPNFESIYTQLDHNYYDRVRHDMAIDGLMRTEDNAADNRYSLHLKTWSVLPSAFISRMILSCTISQNIKIAVPNKDSRSFVNRILQPNHNKKNKTVATLAADTASPEIPPML